MKGSRSPASRNAQNIFTRKCARLKSQAQVGYLYRLKLRLQASYKNCWQTLRQSLTLRSMSAKGKKKQHEILVSKANLTTRSLSPSSEEIFDLMHLTSCDHAIQRWKAHWLLCPVCNATVMHSGDGSYIDHKLREEILV